MWFFLCKTVSFTFTCSVRTATKECLCNWMLVVCCLAATQSFLYLLVASHFKNNDQDTHTRYYIFCFILKDRYDQADYCHDLFYCCTCHAHFIQFSVDLVYMLPIRQLIWSLRESEICQQFWNLPDFHDFETRYRCVKYVQLNIKSHNDWNSVSKYPCFGVMLKIQWRLKYY